MPLVLSCPCSVRRPCVPLFPIWEGSQVPKTRVHGFVFDLLLFSELPLHLCGCRTSVLTAPSFCESLSFPFRFPRRVFVRWNELMNTTSLHYTPLLARVRVGWSQSTEEGVSGRASLKRKRARGD